MDPVSIIKRKRQQTDSDKPCCFFCRSKTGDLRTASAAGKARIRTVGHQRRALCDTSFLDIQERLRTLTEEDMNSQDIKWHKGCYSTFTSETMLERLRKQQNVSPEASTSGNAPASCSGLPSGTTRRSSQSAIDWSRCMFCQVQNKRKVHRVETFEKSKDIIKRAQTDPQVTTRLSGISDLIAVEGCYHLPCLITFERRTDRQKRGDPQTETDVDGCMMTVCRDLRVGLSRGHVYDMGDVWDRYEILCNEMGTPAPKKYQSRRATFYEEIQRFVGPKASYVRPLSKGPPLMYPGEQSDFIISKTLTKSQQHGMFSSFSTDSESSADEDGGVLVFAQGNIFQEMVHVAMRVRQDLLDTPGHTSTWHGLDQAHVDQVVPNSLYLFLRFLFGGITVVEDGIEEDPSIKQTVCSIAQDIVYAVSNKRKLTPKHVGLGLALHQATRSEALLDLFHATNHTIGIDTVRRIDTSIAQNIIDRFVDNGNVYVPDTLVRERMIHCSCDNIDVLEATLDGKNTFHCTQMMVWQRGPTAQQPYVAGKRILRPRTIKPDALQAFQQLDPAVLPSGQRPLPCFGGDKKIEEKWFTNSGDARQKVRAKDMAWVVSRIHDEDKSVPSWGAMNEATSVIDPPVTTAGMLPILQAPADDNDTLTTVINRFMAISHHMGQKHTIITADQPLYSRGKELVWANPKFENVIFLMGGLHICFNFLKSIGQHMDSAGLDDLWTEAGVYAANTTETMLDGKAYYRAVRGHQLTYEALWHLKWPMFKSWLAEHGHEHDVAVEEFAKSVGQVFKKHKNADHRGNLCTAIDQLSDALRNEEVQSLMEKFNQVQSANPNFMLWSTYMSMVEILLDFIRAERDGNWILHLETFTAMLPWLTIYDHTNYARWGPVYLADMKLLEKTAPEVNAEFLEGNFVVKWTKKRFNQVPVDQATEWINRACKMHNGIIGITRNDQARDKFCVTWSERSHISQQTRSLFSLEDDDEETVFSRSDSLPSRTRRDADDVKKLATQLRGFDVFRLHTNSAEEDGDTYSETMDIPLVSLATKDTAPSEVVSDLLTAEERGMQAVITNVKERLAEGTTGFYDALKKHHSKTFADLYKAKVCTTQNIAKTIKADRKLLQRLLNVVIAGRTVEMVNVLKHQLSPFPQSLAKPGGEMNTTSKADLISILMAGIHTPCDVPDADMKTCVLIDGHALIQSLGKPHGCQTFGDLAGVFMQIATRHFGEHITRVDAVFDRYIGKDSIKAVARSKRLGKQKPIRKLIEGPQVPLPQVWSTFIALDENKADLARFLSDFIMVKGKDLPERYEMVTGGGFINDTDAKSTRRDQTKLSGNHEEADTRLILHACEAADRGYKRVLVICRDTDVLLLLVHFMPVVEVWMIAGTAKKRKCYPVHEVSQRLTQPVRDNLLSFHALTGCDTTSAFSGHGKKSCWKTFQKHPLLVSGVGRDGELAPVEEFVCHLYGTPEQPTTNQARLQLFGKAKKGLEMLPPTRDALELHVIRANYQAKIWLQANKDHIDVPHPVATMAWKKDAESLTPVWTRLPPIPDACLELVTCACKSKCKTARCSCFKKNMQCTAACACDIVGCCNPAGQ